MQSLEYHGRGGYSLSVQVQKNLASEKKKKNNNGKKYRDHKA